MITIYKNNIQKQEHGEKSKKYLAINSAGEETHKKLFINILITISLLWKSPFKFSLPLTTCEPKSNVFDLVILHKYSSSHLNFFYLQWI